MALLENITYSPGETMQSAFDKINAAINQINDVLGGGTTGQYPKKNSNTDFDYSFGTLPTFGTGATQDSDLNWKTIDIGDWNMDNDGLKDVTHGLDQTKIRVVQTQIRPDADQTQEYAQIGDGRSGVPAGYINVKSSVITLAGVSGSFFDSTAYNSTGYNRGWVTIGYVD